jgi:hypothetical protein
MRDPGILSTNLRHLLRQEHSAEQDDPQGAIDPREFGSIHELISFYVDCLMTHDWAMDASGPNDWVALFFLCAMVGSC